MSRLDSARWRWVLTRSGSEISERHGLDTHLNRHRDLTGSRDSMSTMSSSGRTLDMASKTWVSPKTLKNEVPHGFRVELFKCF
jgi:hypothetical protein